MHTLYHREQGWLKNHVWRPSHPSEFYPKWVLTQGTSDLTNQRLDSGVLTFKSFILWNAKIEFQGLSQDCQHIFEWYCNQKQISNNLAFFAPLDRKPFWLFLFRWPRYPALHTFQHLLDRTSNMLLKFSFNQCISNHMHCCSG